MIHKTHIQTQTCKLNNVYRTPKPSVNKIIDSRDQSSESAQAAIRSPNTYLERSGGKSILAVVRGKSHYKFCVLRKLQYYTFPPEQIRQRTTQGKVAEALRES